MTHDKREIVLWIGGVLASATVAFLIYRLESGQQAQNAANAANAAAEQESALANQQAEVASLPAISVPTISATPSPTDTSNQATAPATDSTLESFLAALLSSDNSSTTTASTPVASIGALPLPTTSSIPDVIIPALQNFSNPVATSTGGGTPVASPISAAPFSGYSNSQSTNGNGDTYNTNVAKGASLAVQ